VPRRNRSTAVHPIPPGPPTERELAWQLFGGRSALFVVLALAAIALVLPAAAAWDYVRNDRYRAGAVTTDAQVLDKQPAIPSDAGTRPAADPWVRYRFTDRAGVIHTSRHGVSPSEFDRLAVGGTYAVEYLAAEPSTNRLKPGGFQAWGRWAITGGLAAAIGGLSLAAWVLGRRTARRRARVVFHGRPVDGVVTAAELKRAGKAERYVVAYRFADADGAERVGKVDNVSRDAFERAAVGRKVTVLVDPTNPTRHEPDLYGVRG
jgi:hypothetical protein